MADKIKTKCEKSSLPGSPQPVEVASSIGEDNEEKLDDSSVNRSTSRKSSAKKIKLAHGKPESNGNILQIKLKTKPQKVAASRVTSTRSSSTENKAATLNESNSESDAAKKKSSSKNLSKSKKSTQNTTSSNLL